MKLFFSIIIISLSLFLGGCSGKNCIVEVDSIGNLSNQTTYVLIPTNKDVQSLNDLQFLEYSNYINSVLQKKGLKKVDDIKNADIGIFLYYGISDPQKTEYERNIPIYGQTGISSSTTNGTINTNGINNIYGNNINLNSTVNTQTTYTPTYGITGYSKSKVIDINYLRFIRIEAINMPIFIKDKKAEILWKTQITSFGSTNDLREVFPVMVVASENYIGINTGKIIKVEISSNDERINKIKGIK